MCGSIWNWFIHNYVELLGSLSGLLYIYFSIRQSILLWPIGLITSVAYILVFFQSTLYADMGLQIYYVIISIYGWFHWLKGKNKSNKSKQIKIITLNYFQWFMIFVSMALLTFCLYFPLKYFTNASNPLCDGFVSAGSIVATWMLAKKMLEQWLIWIVIDGTSIALFIYKNLYLTALLFIVYTILALIGYIKWRRDWQVQET
jgi:nicotinamide mononucleotide transporter